MKRWKETLTFMLVITHLTSLSGFASTLSLSKPATRAVETPSPEKIAGELTKQSDIAQKTDMIRLPGHVLSGIVGVKPLPASPGSDAQPVALTIVLKHTDQAGFDKYLNDVYDRNSPLFHHFLSPTEVSDRFGPTSDAYKEILDYLTSNGLKLLAGSANRLTLTVGGTRGQAQRVFSVNVRDYQAGGRRFFANDTDPAAPPSLAAHIQAIVGLSNAPRPKTAVDSSSPIPFLQQTLAGVPGIVANAINGKLGVCEGTSTSCASDAVCGGGAGSCLLTSVLMNGQSIVSNAMDIVMLSQESLEIFDPPATGAGQTIGLVAFSSIQTSDIANWLALLGLPSSLLNQVSQVSVNGGAPLGPDESELLLGVETVLAVAPGAQVVVYDGPFTSPGTSLQTIINAMINDGVTIISNSYTYCEDQTTLADVQSIDAILAAAAVSGISVFSAAGDSGSACQDGSANTAAVPADSPHVTAVGGTSVKPGPGFTYAGESWWDGSTSVPPTGQGGFGVSVFFPQPTYQSSLLSGGTMRSIPDVAAPADPIFGIGICEADAGGCPTGSLYGGTSFATPIWAAVAALLNQATGRQFGLLNPILYPLANTSAFHSAASMGTDAAHVGLGSPNVNLMSLALAGLTPGPADPSVSTAAAVGSNPLQAFVGSEPADGSSTAAVVVRLRDSNGYEIQGKSVTLSGNSGSSAVVAPTSVVSSGNGVAIFTVTDTAVETVTFTATDGTDGVTLAQTPQISFIVPPAAGAGINAFPTTVAADNVTASTITLTLKDALGRPTPGKLATLAQGSGHSLIGSPNPGVTDSNGQVEFTVVNEVAETVTYTAVDTTDGLQFPSSTAVQFTSSAVNNACGNANPTAAPGFQATPYATGFFSENYGYGAIDVGGCPGAFGIAFDSSGNLYVGDSPTGNIYKFPQGGGVANSSTLLTPSTSIAETLLGPTLGSLAFDKNGNLFAGRDETTGNCFDGAIFRIDPNTGAVLATVASGNGSPSGLSCPGQIAIDPLSGDLFVTDEVGGNGFDNPSIWRVSNPSGGSPTTSVYATLPGTPAGAIAFAPNGTMYVWDVTPTGNQIVKVSGTNGPATPTVIPLGLPGTPDYIGILAGGTQPNGDAAFLVYNYTVGGSNVSNAGIADLTTTPPTLKTILLTDGVVNNNQFALGPLDGCIYAALGNAVFKITDAVGHCAYTSAPTGPTLTLTPSAIQPNPAQGASQNFTATFSNLSVPAGTAVNFEVVGPNLQKILERTNASGAAAFAYTGVFTGSDSVVASATVGSQTLFSNVVYLNWAAGVHATFLTLSQSPKGGTVGSPVTVIASLTDLSVNPVAQLSGESVSLSLDGDTCFAVTDTNGNASCVVVPTTVGIGALTASFAGSTQLLAASDSKSFSVIGLATTLSYTGPSVLTNGNAATPSAVLTRAQGGSPISNEVITFTLGSGKTLQTCSGTTNSTGTASCNIASVNQPTGSGVLLSSFAGDGTYQDSSVSTNISINAGQVAAPNVVGDTQTAATSAITGAGLVVGTVTTASSSTVPSGSVISQSPTAGTLVSPGSAVNIVVSTGPAQVAAPNVVGDTQTAATSAITGAGLVVGTVTTASSSTVPSGSVISQSPTAGTLVSPGSAVNIVVSTGPAQVAAPNVVGDTQTAATSAITGAGLVVGTVTTASSSTVPSGSVISQSPTAGTLVSPGSAVNIVVSTGPAQVAAPNVVGDTQTAATSAITGAGLVVGTVTTASSSTVPSGSVISQSPTAGTLVSPGSAVNIVVSTGPAQAGKPVLLGQIVAKGKGSSGTIYVDLKLTDTGKGNAVNVAITQLNFRTLCGSGTITYNPALSGALPLKVGNIGKGASDTVRLYLNVPPKVSGFTITESGAMQDTAGSNYTYSINQTVTICKDWRIQGHWGHCDHDDCGHKCDNDISN